MTFPAADILGSPRQRNDINNAAGSVRNSPPSTTTATIAALPSRRSPTLSKSSRSRKISMAASVGGGGEEMRAAKRLDIPTEFYISVEIYLSSRTSIGPRKVCFSLPLRLPQTFHDRIHFSPRHSSLPASPAFFGTPKQPARQKSVDGRLKGASPPLSLCALPINFLDKSSWLSLSNRSDVCAQWRAATCRLTEEEDGCQLNIYIQVSLFCVFSKWPGI